MPVDDKRFAKAEMPKMLDYDTLVHALLEAAEQTGYRARVEEEYSAKRGPNQRREYLFTDMFLTGATLKKRMMSMPVIVRLYSRDVQHGIGFYFDEPALYYRLFPLKYMGRSFEGYARAFLDVLDHLSVADLPEKLESPEPRPLTNEPSAALLPSAESAEDKPPIPPSSEPPEEPLDAVGVRVPNKPKKPTLSGKISVSLED